MACGVFQWWSSQTFQKFHEWNITWLWSVCRSFEISVIACMCLKLAHGGIFSLGPFSVPRSVCLLKKLRGDFQNGRRWGLLENLLHSLADVGRISCIFQCFEFVSREFCIAAYEGDDNGLRDGLSDCVFSPNCVYWSLIAVKINGNINPADLWGECWAIGSFWTGRNTLKECNSEIYSLPSA